MFVAYLWTWGVHIEIQAVLVDSRVASTRGLRALRGEGCRNVVRHPRVWADGVGETEIAQGRLGEGNPEEDVEVAVNADVCAFREMVGIA